MTGETRVQFIKRLENNRIKLNRDLKANIKFYTKFPDTAILREIKVTLDYWSDEFMA